MSEFIEKKYEEKWEAIMEEGMSEDFIRWMMEYSCWTGKVVDMFYIINDVLDLVSACRRTNGTVTKYLYVKRNMHADLTVNNIDESILEKVNQDDNYRVHRITVNGVGYIKVENLEVEELAKPRFFRYDTITFSQEVSTEVSVLVEVDEDGNEVDFDAYENIAYDTYQRGNIEDALRETIEFDMMNYSTHEGSKYTEQEAYDSFNEDDVCNYGDIEWEVE